MTYFLCIPSLLDYLSVPCCAVLSTVHAFTSSFPNVVYIFYLLSSSLLCPLTLWLLFYFFTISGALGESRYKHVCSIHYIKLEAECTTTYPIDSLLMETYSSVFAVITNADVPLYKHICTYGGALLYYTPTLKFL